ncbi:MAG: hypothetical protein JXA89_26875 [Anaerolineae bacterium]|nr:hypothetical protein [Anaerolineae bacterium]
MQDNIELELCALLRVIFDLRVPEEGESRFQIDRPPDLDVSKLGWVGGLIDTIVREVMMTFDLRKKTAHDDPEEIEKWKKTISADGQIERRKNHHLRIKTAVDDLFEKGCPRCDIRVSMRAWKIQVADMCADAILEQYHLRPAASGPWAAYRRSMYDIGQNLQQALAHKDLFLMTGRVDEVSAMETAIAQAHQRLADLVATLEKTPV